MQTQTFMHLKDFFQCGIQTPAVSLRTSTNDFVLRERERERERMKEKNIESWVLFLPLANSVGSSFANGLF